MYTSMHIDIHIFLHEYINVSTYPCIVCSALQIERVFRSIFVVSLCAQSHHQIPITLICAGLAAMQRLGEGRCGKSEPFPNGETTLLANRLQSKFQGSMLCYNLRLLGGIFYAPLLSLLLLLTSFWFSGWWMPYPVSRSQVFQLAKTG